MPATRVVSVATDEGCRDRQYSTLSRFWELENGSDCGTFSFRGYRPLNVSIIVRHAAARRAHLARRRATPARAIDYQAQRDAHRPVGADQARPGPASRRTTRCSKDSLWFGYSQQSNWQIFNGDLSRPFRTTDHEPELMYVYPTDIHLPGGWRWRYAGLGLVHQSNGQSLPYSRSWNRAYLMGGVELDDRFIVTARVWKRIKESAADDDNPDIADFIGRAEVSGRWNLDSDNSWASPCATTCEQRPRLGAARMDDQASATRQEQPALPHAALPWLWRHA